MGLLVDFFEDEDGFADGEVGEVVDGVFSNEEGEDFLALGRDVAEEIGRAHV